VKKSLDTPEETRQFKDGMGQLELVNADAGAVGRATFQPGWQWSKHVKPIAGTDSCQAAHTGYMISGQMTVRMDDGEELTYGPGVAVEVLVERDAVVPRRIGVEPRVRPVHRAPAVPTLAEEADEPVADVVGYGAQRAVVARPRRILHEEVVAVEPSVRAERLD